MVVWITRLISGGNVKNGITCAQARRQAATTAGNFQPPLACLERVQRRLCRLRTGRGVDRTQRSRQSILIF